MTKSAEVKDDLRQVLILAFGSDLDWEPSLVGQVSKEDRKEFVRALSELSIGCDRSFIVHCLALRKAPELLTSDRWESFGRWELRDLGADKPKKTAGHYAGAKDFKRIRKRAVTLMTDIRRLRSTLFIQELIQIGAIRRGDLLHPEMSLDSFDGLLSLAHWAKKWASEILAKREKLDDNKLLGEIVDHIHERTGHWRDRVLEVVHGFLKLPHSADGTMKEWRAARRRRQKQTQK